MVGLAGLLKVEEASYVFMGSYSRSVMSADMPYPDVAVGAKPSGVKTYFEDVAALRSLKMVTLGSFPYYAALAVPFAHAGSLYVSDVLAHPPVILSLSGVVGVFVYFIGYNIIANNRPFDIVKPKVDVIEGPFMECASKWRALAYLMRGLVLFVPSSVFVTLYVGVPFDVTDPRLLAAHLAASTMLPSLAALMKAYSPVLTFRQIMPVSYRFTAVGLVAVGLAYMGV